MEAILENEYLLKFLSSNYTLLDGNIKSIQFLNVENEVQIEIIVHFIRPKKEAFGIKLIFSDIKEFQFYNKSNYGFFGVESYKLFKEANTYYISFDPADETSTISAHDQDFIKCNRITGYILKQ